jgi:hypothetical protein
MFFPSLESPEFFLLRLSGPHAVYARFRTQPPKISLFATSAAVSILRLIRVILFLTDPILRLIEGRRGPMLGLSTPFPKKMR